MKKQNESARISQEVRVDIGSLVNKLGGNKQQVLRCIEIFKADVPKSLRIIKSGLLNCEVKEAKNSCHGLRGMLLTMEMKKASSTAMMMETLIIEKKFEIAAQLMPLLESEINISVTLIENSITEKE
jgi:HPt (histidine-containing phosphotransfer) domain-containing protein